MTLVKESSSFRFFAALLICILTGAEMDIFTPSFPELSKIFNLTPFMVQLTLSLNFIAYFLCSLFTGALSDRYGRRFVIFLGLSIFIVGTLFCILAISFSMLLFGRVLQGIGIAGPAFLGYVLALDDCPLKEQPARLASLEAITTFAMTFSPMIGSYVSFYFNWRANFIVLLIAALVCLMVSFLALPIREKKDPSISLSLHAYLPLLRTQKIWMYLLALCFLEIPYWVFSGISPLLYIDGMGVSLKEFGYYQGAIALGYSFFCFLSAQVFKWVSHKRSLYIGLSISGVGAAFLLGLSILGVQTPFLITAGMLFLIGGTVLPINILYPFALNVLAKSRGRMAALLLCVRLIFTALFLEGVGFFYTGTLFPLGVAMCIFVLTALFFIHRLTKHDWLTKTRA